MAGIPEMRDPRKRLLDLLLERPDYAEAYLRQPEFKSVVDGIIANLPHILRVAHESAKRTEQQRKIALDQRLLDHKPKEWKGLFV